MKIKTGLGYDIHKLEERRKLFLGGIEIPYRKGLLGHSDGDCLIHAIIDALLGAMGDKDIGQIFPDTDPKYKDIRSTELLNRIVSQLDGKNAEILNIDSIILAEEPHLSSYIPRMKEILCPILQIGQEDLGIKAKTNEGLGVIGQGEAIAAWAQVLIKLP
ncbi:MAG: 2-C-methyl-D-erythritol 2,4-cyclodiphosphate synthase [Candidatus Aminicenantes bacterium]|nr:2-C-methyl-D-erythritol 2,4-cyclodiphosphate synthase [Candidatus Aminicenantes bacterium]